jgi:hypothetical protein
MNARHLRAAGIIVLVVVLAGVAALAGKDKCVSLPDAVKAAISAVYPEAEIEESQVEEEGKIIEKETEVALSAVPAAVRAAIAKAYEGGEIEEVTEEVTYWVVTLKRLEAPETTYEAEVVKEGKEIEIELAADGTILEQEVEDTSKKEGCNREKGT